MCHLVAIRAIALAASCSYLTPLEPACLIVYGPGEYRFSDFFRVGSLLTLIIYIPPLMEVLGLAEVEHKSRGNRMRAL